MKPTSATIQSVVVTSDNTGVVVTYQDQDGASYSTTFPSTNAPDQTDVTASDNYDFYTSLILGD